MALLQVDLSPASAGFGGLRIRPVDIQNPPAVYWRRTWRYPGSGGGSQLMCFDFRVSKSETN